MLRTDVDLAEWDKVDEPIEPVESVQTPVLEKVKEADPVGESASADSNSFQFKVSSLPTLVVQSAALLMASLACPLYEVARQITLPPSPLE